MAGAMAHQYMRLENLVMSQLTQIKESLDQQFSLKQTLVQQLREQKGDMAQHHQRLDAIEGRLGSIERALRRSHLSELESQEPMSVTCQHAVEAASAIVETAKSEAANARAEAQSAKRVAESSRIALMAAKAKTAEARSDAAAARQELQCLKTVGMLASADKDGLPSHSEIRPRISGSTASSTNPQDLDELLDDLPEQSSLQQAIRQNNVSDALYLLTLPDVPGLNELDPHSNWSLLHEAILNEMPEIAMALLGREDFKQVNAKWKSFGTCLHLAAARGYQKVCHAILRRPDFHESRARLQMGSWSYPAASMSTASKTGDTALDLARRCCWDDVARLLEEWLE